MFSRDSISSTNVSRVLQFHCLRYEISFHSSTRVMSLKNKQVFFRDALNWNYLLCWTHWQIILNGQSSCPSSPKRSIHIRLPRKIKILQHSFFMCSAFVSDIFVWFWHESCSSRPSHVAHHRDCCILIIALLIKFLSLFVQPLLIHHFWEHCCC